MQTPVAQAVGPVQPNPPHCPYNGARAVVVAVVVVVLEPVVVVVVAVVVGELPLPPYPLTIRATWFTIAAICTPISPSQYTGQTWTRFIELTSELVSIRSIPANPVPAAVRVG